MLHAAVCAQSWPPPLREPSPLPTATTAASCPQVQGMLRAAGRSDVAVEIVFPVSPEAITTDRQAELPSGLAVVPGPAGGEGCSLEGGCASCPFMKMNSLQALMTGG